MLVSSFCTWKYRVRMFGAIHLRQEMILACWIVSWYPTAFRFLRIGHDICGHGAKTAPQDMYTTVWIWLRLIASEASALIWRLCRQKRSSWHLYAIVPCAPTWGRKPARRRGHGPVWLLALYHIAFLCRKPQNLSVSAHLADTIYNVLYC